VLYHGEMDFEEEDGPAANLAQGVRERRPGLVTEAEREAVSVGCVSDEDYAVSAGGLYAVSAVGV
jgi:hypothetical protein